MFEFKKNPKYPIVQTENPRSFQGQNRQFVDQHDDSIRTMIVDKFYHFHHHRGNKLQLGTNIMANEVKTPIQNYFEKVLYENLTI